MERVKTWSCNYNGTIFALDNLSILQETFTVSPNHSDCAFHWIYIKCKIQRWGNVEYTVPMITEQWYLQSQQYRLLRKNL